MPFPWLQFAVLFAATTPPLPVEIEVMVVGGARGGKVEHGKPAYAEIRVRNVSQRSLSVPFAIRPLGKEAAEQQAGPSYRPDKSWWFTGFLFARVTAVFEDSKGRTVTQEQPLVLEDVPKLAPGGYVTLRCIFRSPDATGTYRLRFKIDNTPLREAADAELGMLRGDDLYFAHEIVLNGIEVR